MLLFLLYANKACPYAHKAHMDPIPLLYLFFFCCLKLFGHKQFIPVLPQQQDGKVPVLFGSWSDSYDEHTTHTHKKTNLHNLLPQHLCKHTWEIWRRLGQSLWYSCHWKPGIPRLWAVSPEKNMCVIVMLPCRVICSFSISAVGCALPTSQRWKKTSVTFFSCSDCQATVKSRD